MLVDTWRALSELSSILRLHIVFIAMAAAVTFGWLFSGDYLLLAALLGGLDWLLINLLNRVTDTEEDLANGIRGAGRVARSPRAFLVAWWVIQGSSLVLGYWLHPELTPFRVVVQLIGVGYSYRVVPTPAGLRRFKDIYFLKNFMSSMIFVLTVFAYPLAALRYEVSLPGGVGAVLVLILFFVSFEITYEILYDMRDLEGDRLAKVPTYPVVHGMHRSRQIIDALLASSAACIVLGLATGVLGLREALLLAAPGLQLLIYRPMLRRGISSADCINLTHFGTAQLLLFLAGTHLWLRFGLPANIYLVGS